MNAPAKIDNFSWIKTLLLPPVLSDDVYNQAYTGEGTLTNPFIIDFLPKDPHDPTTFSTQRKWAIALLQSASTFVVTFASSAYVSGIPGVQQQFGVSVEVATLGLSFFVLGFALGPLVWAPLSELYGRKSVFIISFAACTAFSVAAACSQNIPELLILRFFASAFGSSSMTNAGVVISDMFSRMERGPPLGIFATAAFLGPGFGPIVGGSLAETQGWRWPLGLVAILTGVVWISTSLVTRETYAPCILRRRVKALSRRSAKLYVSRIDAGKPPQTLFHQLWNSFSRPWIFLFLEPIVLLTSLYVSVIYGTLYMLFAGIPIIFQGSRGWSQGLAGLPFIGVAVGAALAAVISGLDSKRYSRSAELAESEGRRVDPEGRLRSAMVGSILLPLGLLLFAWTTYPSVSWIFPILGATLFSCGLVMAFTSLVGYLVDSYTVYSASVMAANSVLRSLFGTAFPLFTTQMYDRLGNQWASSIPAFLTLACLPFPWLFYKYGKRIRARCKYSSEAQRLMEMMRRRHLVERKDKPAEGGKDVAQP